jgi:PAS domain S-box-containing protein
MAELANDGVITERRFKGLVEAVSSYAIFMLDMRGNVASWNAGAERIKGYKADEIIGEHFSVFYMDEDRQAGLPMRELAAAAAEGKFEHVGWRVHKDGRRFWANAVIDAIYEPDGALVGYVKVIRDITAQRGLEDRFRQVVESAPNAMVMIGESGLIEMVNAQAEQMFGYAREELLDQKVEMLVPERFRHGHPKLRATFFEDPRSRPMGAGRDLYGLKKDGGEFPIEIGLNPIETEEGVKVLSAIVDISSRKQLENRFRQVVESAPNAMVMVDPMGQIAMVNAQAEKVFGYERAELLHQSIEMLVPARFRARHPELRTNFFSSPAARPMGVGRDLYGLRKDGSEFPIEIGLNPIETDEGQMVLSAIVDISGRKQLEERFRQVVESAPNAMVMIAASGRIVMVNAQAEGVFGYDRAELLDQPVEILVPERFRGQHPGLRTGFFDRPESRPMGVGRDLYGLKKDGSEFPIEIGLNPIETEDGPMVLSAIVDISSRKRLEERFRRVVEAAPNAMVMIGPTGRIEMVNAQAERVFGYERGEMLGQSIEFLVPERFRGHHPGLRTAFFADPHSRPMGAGRDLYGLAKDGSEFPVEIGLNPIETDEGPMVLSAIVDISDRKQKEERIQAALREKDTLLGEIHHRVKNNLQVVHSLLDLQGDLVTDEKILGILRESQNRIKSMALIHQTLYESKDFVQVDFSTFLESLAPTLISSYGMDAERVSLVIEAAEVLLPINAAIPCGLVVNELISNALKHAFPAGRRGEIRIELAPEPDGRAMLSVSDDGVGIAEDYDLTRTTTLGLQLVALLTDQLGGEIEIQRSNPTRFILRFPIE